jgi:hypothetical protein
MIKLDIGPFLRLKQGPLRLKPWRKSAPPASTRDPIKAILNFARYIGLRTIPAKTVEKLRSDPHFRYCFYQLDLAGAIYEGSSATASETRDTLVRLLQGPDSMTDRDLALGLSCYLNNFITYMPGTKGMIAELIGHSPVLVRIRDTVREVLEEKKLLERALELRYAPGDAALAAFLKLSLDIFQVMVGQKGYSPEILWR